MTITSRTADLDAMLKDAGVAVTLGAQSTYGILKVEDITVQLDEGMAAIERHPVLTIRTGTLTGLATTGQAITVDGTSYRTRRTLAADDGLVTKLILVEA